MMKRPALLAALSVLSICSFAAAHAATISQISIDGSDKFNVTGSTGSITFFNPASVGAGSTGNFSVFTSADTNVNMFPGFGGGPLPFALGFQTVLSRLGTPSVLALATTQGANTLDFFMTDYSVSLFSGVAGCSLTCLDVTGDGFYTETGFPQLPGSFTFTTQAVDASGTNEVTFSATGFETPEPSSLLLLGTGILGVAGIARRKLLKA